MSEAAARATGTPVLSACVMTHPDRLEAARRLRDRHPELGLDIVTDPEPAAPVRSALRTARAAWAAAHAAADHHLVLQDDVVLCEGFLDHVRDAVARRPDDVLALFCEWGARTAAQVRTAALFGSRWAAVADSYVPTQAVVMPRALAAAFAAWDAGEETADDRALWEFLRAAGRTAVVAVPNLAEHPDDSGSVVGNGFMGVRRSACFLPGGPASAGAGTERGETERGEVVRGEVVRADETLYMSWMRGVAEWQRTSDPVFGGPPAPGALDHLASRGVDRERVAVEGQARIAALRQQAPGLEPLGTVVLFELFAGYYCLGFDLGERGHEAAGAAGGEAVQSAAFATAAPGALRRFVGVDYLERHRDALGAFALAALRAGNAAGLARGAVRR